MMPEWVWYIAIAVSALLGAYVNEKFGVFHAEEDGRIAEGTYTVIEKHRIDANKECVIHKLDMEHEEEMALIARGAYDDSISLWREMAEEPEGGNDN